SWHPSRQASGTSFRSSPIGIQRAYGRRRRPTEIDAFQVGRRKICRNLLALLAGLESLDDRFRTSALRDAGSSCALVCVLALDELACANVARGSDDNPTNSDGGERDTVADRRVLHR